MIHLPLLHIQSTVSPILVGGRLIGGLLSLFSMWMNELLDLVEAELGVFCMSVDEALKEAEVDALSGSVLELFLNRVVDPRVREDTGLAVEAVDVADVVLVADALIEDDQVDMEEDMVPFRVSLVGSSAGEEADC